MNALTNVTVFAPSERALKELPESFLKNLKENPEKLKEFLMYHIVTPKTCHCDFADNKILETGLPGKSLRMNKYGGLLPVDILDPSNVPVTVQCARVTQTDTEVCGGMIHTVNKVLLPPGNYTPRDGLPFPECQIVILQLHKNITHKVESRALNLTKVPT